MPKHLFFKATNKTSKSCKNYRQIAKKGNKTLDQAFTDDDVIHIFIKPNKQQQRIIIDCDKKTGEFALSLHNY